MPTKSPASKGKTIKAQKRGAATRRSPTALHRTNKREEGMIVLVTGIIDGDTFDASLNTGGYGGRGGYRVRIAGMVDTPERGQPGYWEAKNKLSDLILNKEVMLLPKAADAYGRLVSDVLLGGENIRPRLGH